GPPGRPRPPILGGRGMECAAVDRMLAEVRAGESRVLALRGEPGIGKTALLDYAVGAAAGFRVLRVVAVASETELAFGSLHQLCLPILDQLDQLPPPQRHALE